MSANLTSQIGKAHEQAIIETLLQRYQDSVRDIVYTFEQKYQQTYMPAEYKAQALELEATKEEVSGYICRWLEIQENGGNMPSFSRYRAERASALGLNPKS
jgi:hypothetical protein